MGIIEQLGPEVKAFAMLTLAGILGAAANAALDREPLSLPKVRRGALHLGFVGTLIISVVAAHAVDHAFSTALIAAVGGAATLKRLKNQVDVGFEREQRRRGRG